MRAHEWSNTNTLKHSPEEEDRTQVSRYISENSRTKTTTTVSTRSLTHSPIEQAAAVVLWISMSRWIIFNSKSSLAESKARNADQGRSYILLKVHFYSLKFPRVTGTSSSSAEASAASNRIKLDILSYKKQWHISSDLLGQWFCRYFNNIEWKVLETKNCARVCLAKNGLRRVEDHHHWLLVVKNWPNTNCGGVTMRGL